MVVSLSPQKHSSREECLIYLKVHCNELTWSQLAGVIQTHFPDQANSVSQVRREFNQILATRQTDQSLDTLWRKHVPST